MNRRCVYDDASGWCLTHETWPHRDDGRRVNLAGHEIEPGPRYTPAELDHIATQHQQIQTRRNQR